MCVCGWLVVVVCIHVCGQLVIVVRIHIREQLLVIVRVHGWLVVAVRIRGCGRLLVVVHVNVHGWLVVGGLYSAPLIPAESGGFQRNELWQDGLLFSSFRCLIIPAECGHSGIETGMFCGMCRNGMKRNLVVCLFSIGLLIICHMSQPLPLLLPPPPQHTC